jgi:hypothetical protein
MRTQLLAYLTANLTGSIKPSQELPFEQSGNSLYLKNLRRVYLNEPSTEQDQLIGTFDDDINQQITTVQAFLAVDAKNRNSDLDSALTTMSQALKQADITDSFRKEFDYTTTLDDDKIIYEFEYRYYQII